MTREGSQPRRRGQPRPLPPPRQRQSLARQERARRARALRRAGKRVLARKLEHCCPSERCDSGACPVCQERLQTRFAKALRRVARRALDRGYEVAVVTWIPAGAAIPPGELHTRDHVNQVRVWKRRLNPTSMHWFLGGVDFSLNEDRVGGMPPYWSPHLHGLAVTECITQLKGELKEAAGHSPEVKRSTRVEPWDGRLNAAMYPLAGEFSTLR